jgi:phenylacetic acid degradation operon negative regulatory protein
MLGAAMRPRSLLMTFFGAFLRQLGGWIAVADLIALMADVDLDEQAVRSAVSRLKRRGVIAAERRDGAAGYRLTEHGVAILEAGDARIFERPASGAPEWLLVLFSVPEAPRALRPRLRTRLAWLGLGSVGSAVWIGPAHVEGEVRLLVEELGLAAHVSLFRAAHAGFEPLPEAVAAWWDLDAIAAEYRAYLRVWGARGAPARPFSDYLRQLDDWRRIPFHDPGLPADALPDEWPGAEAWALFGELSERLGPVAREHVEARLGGRARAA